MKIICVILAVLVISSCKSKKMDWPLALKTTQQQNNITSNYFINFNYINKKRLKENNMITSFYRSDTIFLIEKIDNMSAMTGDSYIWDNNRDSGLLYFDEINPSHLKNDNKNLYILKFKWISYNDIDSSIKYLVENFDTAKIQKNTTLGGRDIVISRIIKNGKIESYHFFE